MIHIYILFVNKIKLNYNEENLNIIWLHFIKYKKFKSIEI